MLKTRRGDQYWLVTQPDHGGLAGTLAAHWGNKEFAQPGDYEPAANGEELRREVVLAIAEHDNGWWEWEADPPLSPDDGLPQGLSEVLKHPLEGMERWRLGIPRLAARHPYASLIISYHAYWLYATQFEPDAPAEFTHQLQRTRRRYPKELQEPAMQFMAEVRAMQQEFVRRIGKPEQVEPHARLLQTLDAMSLSLCSNVIAPVEGEAQGFGNDHVIYDHVPRRSWADRVSLETHPAGDGRMVITPYPFDTDPLEVAVRARVAGAHENWRCAPWVLARFRFASV
jgi:hypothetical protein